MGEIERRDVEYQFDGTAMRGLFVLPSSAAGRLPTVLLLHDAFGLGDDMIAIAEELAGSGRAVFAADVWGERRTPTEQSEIGALIGSMAGDRAAWQGRVAEALRVAAAQPEADADRIAVLGYCFGGSSALELLRTGGRVRGVIAIHPGLDLIAHDWSAAEASGTQVHIAVGSIDPMATRQQRLRLEDDLTAAGADWEIDLYSRTTHAFTSLRSQNSPHPELFDHHPRNATRAWQSTTRVLDELFPRDSAV